jgi:hypothetical protein
MHVRSNQIIKLENYTYHPSCYLNLWQWQCVNISIENNKMWKSMYVGKDEQRSIIYIYEYMWIYVQQLYDYNLGEYDWRETKISWANQVSITGWVDSRLEVVELIMHRFLLVSKASTSLLKEQLLLSFRDIYKRSFTWRELFTG